MRSSLKLLLLARQQRLLWFEMELVLKSLVLFEVRTFSTEILRPIVIKIPRMTLSFCIAAVSFQRFRRQGFHLVQFCDPEQARMTNVEMYITNDPIITIFCRNEYASALSHFVT